MAGSSAEPPAPAGDRPADERLSRADAARWGTIETIHETTLGDLVTAAYQRAARTSEAPLMAGRVAARDVETSLKRANRLDVIRTLALIEKELRVAAPSIARGTTRVPSVRSGRQERRVAIAAAG